MSTKAKKITAATLGVMLTAWIGWAWYVNSQETPTGELHAQLDTIQVQALENNATPSAYNGDELQETVIETILFNEHGVYARLGRPIETPLTVGQAIIVLPPEPVPAGFDDRAHYLWYRGLGQGYDWVRRNAVPVNLMASNPVGSITMGVLYSASFLHPSLEAYTSEFFWGNSDTFFLLWVQDRDNQLQIPVGGAPDVTLSGWFWGSHLVDVRGNTYYFVAHTGNMVNRSQGIASRALIETQLDRLTTFLDPVETALDFEAILANAEWEWPLNLQTEGLLAHPLDTAARLDVLALDIADGYVHLYYVAQSVEAQWVQGNTSIRLELLDPTGQVLTPVLERIVFNDGWQSEPLFDDFPDEMWATYRRFAIGDLDLGLLGLQASQQRAQHVNIQPTPIRIVYEAPALLQIAPQFEETALDMGNYAGVWVTEIELFRGGVIFTLEHDELMQSLRREHPFAPNMFMPLEEHELRELFELDIALDFASRGKQSLADMGGWNSWDNQLIFHTLGRVGRGSVIDLDDLTAIYLNGTRIRRTS